MNKCLGNLRDTICIPYLNDVFCYEITFDEHLQNLKTVLKHLKEFRIKLKSDKYVLFKSEVKYLGNIVHLECYRDNPTILDKIFATR